jgi:sugar-specific transcriptional regulator TrmB
MERYLKELGFSEGEEKAYMALLKLGDSTTGPIAKESGLSRSKLYEILEKLAKKGVVSHFKKNNVSYFAAAPPKRISEYLKEKEANLEIQRKEFEKNIPFLENIFDKKLLSQEAEVYEGIEGMKNVREMVLNKMNKGETAYYIGIPLSAFENMAAYWNDWNMRRLKKKVYAKIIYNQDCKEFGEQRRKLSYTEIKYLLQKGPSNTWIEIYGDTVAIVTKYQTPMSIVINNKFVAESFKTYFDILWATSKEKI